MAGYIKHLQSIVEEYRGAGQPWPTQPSTIAAWAISQRRWNLPRSKAVDVCAEDLARAMREEYFTDPQGRRVRAKIPISTRRNGKQITIWDDARTAPREHMQNHFQMRRNGIVGDCKQLKLDVDSYNDRHPTEPPIQLVLDFKNDVAEAEALAS